MSRRREKSPSLVRLFFMSVACLVFILALSGIAMLFRDENAEQTETDGMTDERIREIQERYEKNGTK
jgi:hypothetical protein